MRFEQCSQEDGVLDSEGWEQGFDVVAELGLSSYHQGWSLYSRKRLGHRRHIELNFGQFVSATSLGRACLSSQCCCLHLRGKKLFEVCLV